MRRAVALWHGQARLSIAGLELFQRMAQNAAGSRRWVPPLTAGPVDPMTVLMPRLAIYQPDIPQNTGTMLRLAACLGVPVEIIEPAAFDVSDRNLRRSGMDYLHH